MKKLHLFLFVMLLALGLALVACGGGETPASEEAAPAEEEPVAEEEVEEETGEIVIWSRYDLTDTEDSNAVALNARIEAFEAETGITVVYEQIAWESIRP